MPRSLVVTGLLTIYGGAAGSCFGLVVGGAWVVYQQGYEFPGYERAVAYALALTLAGLVVGLSAGFLASRRGVNRVIGLAAVGILGLAGIAGLVEETAFHGDHLQEALVDGRLSVLITSRWSDDLLLQNLSIEPAERGPDVAIRNLVLELPQGWPEPAAGDVPSSVVVPVPSGASEGLEVKLVYFPGVTDELTVEQPFGGYAGPPDALIARFGSDLGLFVQAYSVRPSDLEWAVGRRRREVEAFLWLRLFGASHPAWLLKGPDVSAIIHATHPGYFWVLLFDAEGKSRGELYVRFDPPDARADLLSLVGQILWHARFEGEPLEPPSAFVSRAMPHIKQQGTGP